MQARFSYPLLFLVPSAMAACVVGVVVAAAGGGILWLFVYGDSTWPRVADTAVMALAALASTLTLAFLLCAGYSFGRRREVSGGLSVRHIVIAIAISVLLPALAVLYEWQVGNLG